MSIQSETQPKTVTLEARITAEQEQLIERAAAYQGSSVSDFVVSSVQAAAKAVIREQEVLLLNGSQSRTFVETLLNPPDPNQALQEATAQYRQDVISR